MNQQENTQLEDIKSDTQKIIDNAFNEEMKRETEEELYNSENYNGDIF